MAAPLDQSILDLLRTSAVGPMLDRPVNDVLKDLGLPPLPEIPALPPLPDLPPLPVIDISALARPLTDLASGFGTGQLGGDPAVDPAQVLAQASSVVQTAAQLGISALQLAMTLWQGAGAAAAEGKAAQTAADSTAVSAQSLRTSAGVAAAAGTVFRGGTAMSAIIAKYLTSLTAAAPFLATPPGQVFVLAMSAETLAEATAVVAATRAELSVHSAEMTATGTKVPVTNAPTGVDPTQLMQIVPLLANAATTGAKTVADVVNSTNTRDPLERERERMETIGPGVHPTGTAVGAMGARAIGGATAPMSRPLGPWSGGVQSATSSGPGGATPASSTTAVHRGGAVSPGSGLMPMGAGAATGMARGAGVTGTSGELHALLVTEQHGMEVVGEVEGAAPPVVGAADRFADPGGYQPPPDKELTL
ncbi:hypothetical protein [Nocardia pneumoniae]|uniref:hypothetical protein n=1 Tax=Nocardia pneumoniae TaxID=228601 RepID=UPI000593BA70|nr:hypothetical protein [Nocardia pneumoniae]